MPQMRGQSLADDHLGTHDPMRLGVAAAFVVTWRVSAPHIAGEGGSDRFQTLLFVRLDALLGQLEALVRAPAVDQVLEQSRERLAECPVGCVAKERLEAA